MEGDLADILILCWTRGSDSIILLWGAVEWGKLIYWAMLMGVGAPQPFTDSNDRKEDMESIQVSLNSIDLLFSLLNDIIQWCIRAVLTKKGIVLTSRLINGLCSPFVIKLVWTESKSQAKEPVCCRESGRNLEIYLICRVDAPQTFSPFLNWVFFRDYIGGSWASTKSPVSSHAFQPFLECFEFLTQCLPLFRWVVVCVVCSAQCNVLVLAQ